MFGGILMVLSKGFIHSIQFGKFENRFFHTFLCLLRINFHYCKMFFFLKRVPFIRDGLTATGRTDKQNIHSAKPLENVKILEIGCGAGILTEVLTLILSTL